MNKEITRDNYDWGKYSFVSPAEQFDEGPFKGKTPQEVWDNQPFKIDGKEIDFSKS